MAAEFFLFDHFGARRHTPFYPRWNDQIQYLTESYSGYEFARAHGMARGLVHALINPSAQGTLHDVFALVAFGVAGPSRAAALALNVLALIAWQAALFFAVFRLARKPALAFAVALLPLALLGPWEPVPGSAYDFRLDHLAMCGIGICAALALLTDGLRAPRESTWFGVAVGVTIATRFLTSTYFAVVLVALIGWILRGSDQKSRLLNLGRAALAALLIAGPLLWLNWASVRDYYWIGHFIGPESAIRNQHMGLGRSLGFVGGQLAQRHLGLFFGVLALGGGGALGWLRGAERKQPGAFSLPWIVGGIFTLAPALVLTLHRQKSEVVVSALAPGVVVLVIALWLCAGQRVSERTGAIFAAAVGVLALGFFARKQLVPIYSPAQQQDLRLVNSLADQIFGRARAGGLRDLSVGEDYITDCLDAQVLRVICYERHHVLIPVNMTLPTGIAEPDEAAVFARLADSDFVFLTEEAAVPGFPYDRKLAALRPQLRAWCDTHLRGINQFTLFGRRMLLYQRREIPFP